MSPAVHSRRLTAGEIVIELHTTARPEGQERAELKRTLQMRRSARDLYVIEMVEEDTPIECMRIMLADYNMAGRPWPAYRRAEIVTHRRAKHPDVHHSLP